VEAIVPVAGMMTTAAFVPQALKTWRTRSVHDGQPGAAGAAGGGQRPVAGGYGALAGSAGLVAANRVTVPLTVSILWVKLARG
jgi:MtN3 and saliva related transmembrane protein